MANKPTPQIDPLPGMGPLGMPKPKPQTNLVQQLEDLKIESRIIGDRNDDYQECLTEVFELLATSLNTVWTAPDGLIKKEQLLKQAARKIIDVGGIVPEDAEALATPIIENAIKQSHHHFLAANYDEWMEFIDPDGIMEEDEFNTLTVAEKIEIIREVA